MSEGRLTGKSAIITGAASGIGRATAELFAREGAKLTLADINEENLKDICETITGRGQAAIMKVTDVTRENDVKALVDAALEAYSQIDILVNNAGVLGGLATLDMQTELEWTQLMAVNVHGAVFGTKYVAKHMQDRKTGSIVNVASIAGFRSGGGGNAYSASKAALINFTQTAACDLGADNVRVNAVCPGLIETGMTQEVFDRARETGKEARLGYRCELRRSGNPDEVAMAVLFLAGDESSYITGHALAVDGGNAASLNLPGMKF